MCRAPFIYGMCKEERLMYSSSGLPLMSLGDLNPVTKYRGIRKDTLSDVLNLPVLRLHRLRSDVVGLVLILWLHLLSYAIELVQVLLPVLLFLLFLVHAITSGIVCAEVRNVYREDLFILFLTLIFMLTLCRF